MNTNETFVVSPGDVLPGRMSLREYFAGQALAGIATGSTNMTPNYAARLCAMYADALIEELSK